MDDPARHDEKTPPEWFDPLPDLPGVRNRWRHWSSAYVDGIGPVTIEEIYGEAYLMPSPPMHFITTIER